MKKHLILFSIICCHLVSYGQKYLNPKNIQIGTSFFYFPTLDFEEKNIYNQFEQHFNWSVNISTSITPRLQIGLENMLILNSEFDKSNLVRSNVFGIFSQYSVFSDKKNNFFVELGAYRGNYCSCFPNFSYRSNQQMWYYGFGAGYNLYLRKGFILDVGFNNYKILGDIPRKSNFTRPTIGINYLINFKKTVRSNG
jgi:hypothetical protein